MEKNKEGIDSLQSVFKAMEVLIEGYKKFGKLGKFSLMKYLPLFIFLATNVPALLKAIKGFSKIDNELLDLNAKECKALVDSAFKVKAKL